MWDGYLPPPLFLKIRLLLNFFWIFVGPIGYRHNCVFLLILHVILPLQPTCPTLSEKGQRQPIMMMMINSKLEECEIFVLPTRIGGIAKINFSAQNFFGAQSLLSDHLHFCQTDFCTRLGKVSFMYMIIPSSFALFVLLFVV